MNDLINITPYQSKGSNKSSQQDASWVETRIAKLVVSFRRNVWWLNGNHFFIFGHLNLIDANADFSSAEAKAGLNNPKYHCTCFPKERNKLARGKTYEVPMLAPL